MEREFHAVADLFPLMQGAAFDELTADVRKNGLREPILVDREGRILDGRNRYRACLAASVEPRFETWQGAGSTAELSLSLNLKRRHLDESQRAMVAARLAKMLKDTRPARGANLHPAKSLKIHDEAAAAVNISRRLVICATKLLNHGCDELIAAVDSGVIAVSTASDLTALPQVEQAQAAAGGLQGLARKARELRVARKAAVHSAEAWPFWVFSGAPARTDVTMFWVATGGAPRAIEVLKAGGFRHAPSSG